jgi:hypothetical protein
MDTNTLIKRGIRRLLIIFVVSVVLVLIMGEVANNILPDTGRAPEDVLLVIPAGTADKIARGEPEPTLPDQMRFVTGDVLIVQNDDSVDHELGPLFIPAGTSASLVMEEAAHYDYTCSFQPSQFLGLAVTEATDLNVRIIAVLYVAPATAIFIFIYSLALRPLYKPEPA